MKEFKTLGPTQFGIGDGSQTRFGVARQGDVISSAHVESVITVGWQGEQLLSPAPRTNLLLDSNDFTSNVWRGSPSFYADFSLGPPLDPRIVFTRNTPVTYWEGGVLKTAAAGEPVFEDGAWRMEPSMTNKITARKHNPIDFSNTSTVPESSDPAAVYSISDDALALEESGLGNVCTNGMVYKIDNSGGTGKAYFQFYGATGSLNTHTISGYMRGSGSASIRLENMPITNEPLTDRYVRRSVTQVPPSQSSTTVVEVAPGAVCYVILPQMEGSTILTSVVPGNTLSAVTRAADNATITGAAFADMWNANDGAFIVEYASYIRSTGSYGEILLLPTAGALPRLAMANDMNDGTGRALYCVSTDATNLAVIYPGQGVTLKSAFVWNEAEGVAAFIDGQKYPFTTAAKFDRSLLTGLYLRTYGGLIRIKRITFYKTRPSDAQMEALTS